MKKLFQNKSETCYLGYDVSKQMIYMEVSGQIQEPEYKEMFYKLLYGCREFHQVNKILIDLTNLGGVKGASRAWLVENFAKRFNDEFGKGMWVAVIEPAEDNKRKNLNTLANILKNQKLNFRLEVFNSDNEGVQWLMLNS